MPTRFIETIGHSANSSLIRFGEFFTFVFKTMGWLFGGGLRPKNLRLLLPQMFQIGVQSLMVIGITGAFIGMVMAVETYSQFKSLGQEERLGSFIVLSVVKQIGPVLTGVMLAGRIGGALTAELGTMNVTEQLDALRVMGTDPIRFLVVPRFIACLILTPLLTVYSDGAGILGGWVVAVKFLGVPDIPYRNYAIQGVEMWQINEGIIKAFFFGAAIGLISCYKGFTCGSGASGVGRACTEAFVATFVSIIIMNFFFANVSHDWYVALFGNRTFFGS